MLLTLHKLDLELPQPVDVDGVEDVEGNDEGCDDVDEEGWLGAEVDVGQHQDHEDERHQTPVENQLGQEERASCQALVDTSRHAHGAGALGAGS